MVADFQQYYGLDALTLGLDSYEDSAQVERAGILLAQLPNQSRVFEADNPDLEWSTEAQFLRLIEYDLRCIVHSLSNGKGKKPRPIDTPSEAQRKSNAIDTAQENEREIADLLASILPQSDEPEGGDD